MRQQNGARACGALVCSPWSAHSGLLRAFLPILVKYTRSFNIQPAKKHSFYRYCVISWGRFSTKKTLSNPSSPSGRSTFLSCRSFHQIGELWILLLHSFAEIKMIGLHLSQPASQDWPDRRKNTSNHCFVFINTFQSLIRRLITSGGSLPSIRSIWTFGGDSRG